MGRLVGELISREGYQNEGGDETAFKIKRDSQSANTSISPDALQQEEQRHLTAAHGFLELGMPLEANAELELIEPVPSPPSRSFGRSRWLERWDLMSTVAKSCSSRSFHGEMDDQVRTRFAKVGVGRAKLGSPTRCVYPVPIVRADVRYNLACCECQLGNIETARQRLKEAFQLDPN